MIAKIVRVHLADNEWGNRVMERVARETFESFPQADVVIVYEHAGWACRGTATACWWAPPTTRPSSPRNNWRYRASIKSTVTIAEIRRQVAPMGDALLV